MFILATFSLLALVISLINFWTIRTVKNQPAVINKKVSILIPMRNEAKNVTGCVDSIINQLGLTNFEIIALDDQSTDGTSIELQKYKEIKVLAGANLPQDWLGKLWACHQLSQAASGEILVFLDADVRLKENAIASSIAAMQDWDFISPYPKQLSIGLFERIFQPLLHWSWFSSVPLVISQKFGIKSMAVANGQFFIVSKNAYEKSGGHQKIKKEVLDDLELSRSLLSAGYKGGVAEGGLISECLMYRSLPELISGYRKSLWKAFGGAFPSVLVTALLLLTGVFTFISAISGSKVAALAFISIYLSRIISSLKSGESTTAAIFHPIAILIFTYITINSWIGRATGTLTWRDRVIS